MEGRRANRINPLNSLQRRLGAPPAVLPNKWSMLLFNSIKQNYKSQRWLINLNRLLCMKFFFNCLLEKTVTDDAFLPLFFPPPPPSFSFWHELYLLEFLVISFPSEVLAWLDRGLRANQLNERRSNVLIMVPDLVQTELGLVQRCLPLCMGEAGSCSPQCTPTLLCSSRSAPQKRENNLRRMQGSFTRWARLFPCSLLVIWVQSLGMLTYSLLHNNDCCGRQTVGRCILAMLGNSLEPKQGMLWSFFVCFGASHVSISLY